MFYKIYTLLNKNLHIISAQFSDRFTPGEAVASGQFAKHRQHAHNHAHSSNAGNNKVASASQIVQQTYKPPQNIYSFPPNINSHYSSPYQDPKATLPSSNVNSYAASPSGPLLPNTNFATASSNDNGYKYPGPTDPDNLPPAGKDADDAKSPATSNDAGAGDANSDDTIGVLPASAMDDGNKDMNGKDNTGGDDMEADGRCPIADIYLYGIMNIYTHCSLKTMTMTKIIHHPLMILSTPHHHQVG